MLSFLFIYEFIVSICLFSFIIGKFCPKWLECYVSKIMNSKQFDIINDRGIYFLSVCLLISMISEMARSDFGLLSKEASYNHCQVLFYLIKKREETQVYLGILKLSNLAWRFLSQFVQLREFRLYNYYTESPYVHFKYDDN